MRSESSPRGRQFEDRNEGDYTALSRFEPDYVKSQVEATRQFLSIMSVWLAMPD